MLHPTTVPLSGIYPQQTCIWFKKPIYLVENCHGPGFDYTATYTRPDQQTSLVLPAKVGEMFYY